VAVIDPTGKFVLDFVIYPNEEPKKAKAKEELEKVIEALQIKHITIGDGTYGREALEFVEKNIDAVKSGEVKAMLTSEAGASVYSASQVAIDEFPDKDITVRGAISIARRFQDPLSELVKIEPKSIGVGQYQHDVHQGKLKRSLGGVVEDCVNHVGVDLNTASFHVLSFISGIGPALSKNIVAHRDKNGKFLNRKDLLKVDRFSEKIFEQAAGFMRIYDSAHPLDRTFVHPERYLELEKWCSENGHEVSDLLGEGETLQKLSKDETVTKSMGELTFQDVLLSLRAPSQDPRTVFKSTEFKKGLKSLADLKVGDWYPGVINNITNFGAFVNIGIKESGLIHISQMSEKFVEDPLKIVKVGQEVKVRVLEIDKERNRLALSCKSEFNGSEPKVGGAFGENRPHRRRPMRQEFRQNKPQESSNSDRSRPPSRGAGSGHIQEQHKARLEFNKHPRLSSRADSRSGAKPKSRTESRPSGRTDSRGKSERFERPRRADGARPGQFNTRFQGKASAAPPGHQNKDKKEDPNSPFAALKNFKVKQ
jgi:protein Tex